MKSLLLVLFASALYANVCTPLTAPASGVFPAVVNGIDGVGSYSARISWTSDATGPAPATNQRVEYATAAEWAGAPGVYPHLYFPNQGTISDSTHYQSALLSNLAAATTYHVAGQSYQSGAWCSVTDETFTTAAAPIGIVKPVLPTKPSTTIPTISGTDWLYGSTCGTSGSGTVKMQDCFTKAQPGDGIALPPGTYSLLDQVTVPDSPHAVPITCSTGTSFCTQSGSAPANNTQIVLSAGPNEAPSPINPGIPYYVVNSSGSTFQLSFTSGGSPITLVSATYSPSYILYSYFNGGQPGILVHSTASASLLPPVGVRLNPATLAQYAANMPNIQCGDPNPLGGTTGYSCFTFSPLAGGYYFENIQFSTDPAIYTNSVTAAGGIDFDPVGFNIVGPTSHLSNFNLIFDRCAMTPAPPPSRSVYMSFDGVNVGWINSLFSGLDWWQPFNYSTTPVSYTSNSITIPAYTQFWVTSGGTSGAGQRASCSVSAASVTGIGGSGTGSFAVWMDHSCALHAQFPTGTTYSTATNITVTTAGTPAFPTYTLTTNGHPVTAYTVIPVAKLAAATIVSGTITNFANNQTEQPSQSAQPVYQSGGGIELDGWGPFLFDNDSIQGAEIGGPFITDGVTSGTPCYPETACPQQQQIGNLTVTRSSIFAHPSFLYPLTIGALGVWNGGNYFWRNAGESKAGKWTLQDGDIFGPWGAGAGYGQCGLHEAFVELQTPGYINYIDSSEWTFTNNTCVNMGSAGITVQPLSVQSLGSPYPIKNILIQNNLFLKNNAWYVTGIQPMGGDNGITNVNDGGCGGTGWLDWWEGTGESISMNHNTVFGQGGCQSTFEYIQNSLSSNHYLTNNFFNIVGFDPAFGALAPGSYYYPYGTSSPTVDPCLGLQANDLFNGSGSCPGITAFHWGGNVMLATWKNSNPASLVEYNSTDVSANTALYPIANWPSNATLADRIASVKWFDSANGNLRLRSDSPYISGNQQSAASPTSDGLDVGADMDQIAAHQGAVSNVRILASTSTTATIGLYAPDSFACGVDWTTNAWSTWTRVSGAAGSPDPRVQSVALTGITAHAAIVARVNCAVSQPLISVQLP